MLTVVVSKLKLIDIELSSISNKPEAVSQNKSALTTDNLSVPAFSVNADTSYPFFAIEEDRDILKTKNFLKYWTVYIDPSLTDKEKKRTVEEQDRKHKAILALGLHLSLSKVLNVCKEVEKFMKQKYSSTECQSFNNIPAINQTDDLNLEAVSSKSPNNDTLDGSYPVDEQHTLSLSQPISVHANQAVAQDLPDIFLFTLRSGEPVFVKPSSDNKETWNHVTGIAECELFLTQPKSPRISQAASPASIGSSASTVIIDEAHISISSPNTVC
ncbi:hypothetical protein DSO57_1002628 [Entomophthora muscae]|uniref:Uncharacterized protein n=1 Tax=Entomophthora muscae TaxID=34485 RepID=A0ACC2SYG6_9FUNG|nr:hypothetical protein DSO57_1002628 [Entomophthora muscae]